MNTDIDTTVAIAQLTDRQLIAIARHMERCGSSFAYHLAQLYFCASPSNRRLLLNAFGHVFLDYK